MKRFYADEAGTFWYHSHQGPQRMDGLFGAFIVHDPKQTRHQEFIVQVNDWLHMDGNEYFSSTGLGPGADQPQYAREFIRCVEYKIIHSVKPIRLENYKMMFVFP